MKHFIYSLFFCELLAVAAPRNFLPLQTGNEWVFSVGDGEDRKISVGTQLAKDGFIYYWVKGYAAEAVWVRQADNGDLYFIDPHTDAERLLTSFSQQPELQFVSGLNPACHLEGRRPSAAADFAPMPGASPAAATVLFYRGGCGAEVLEEERYVENLGPVFRKTKSGNYTLPYHLVSARVGALDFNPTPNRGFQIALEQTNLSRERPQSYVPVRGHVRLSATPYLEPAKLRFATWNRLEIVIRNSGGQEMFRYSAAQSNLPIARVEQAGSLWTLPFQFLLSDQQGKPLPDGVYTLTAWLRTEDPEPQFTSQTTIRVGSTAPAIGFVQ